MKENYTGLVDVDSLFNNKTGVLEDIKNWWCYYSPRGLTCQNIGGAIQGLPILNWQILVVL